MKGISDIRIVGVDAKRPPIIRKEPYVDIHYELSNQPPAAWCEHFNALTKKAKFAATIKADEGLYIDTWVRHADEVVEALQFVQSKVRQCSEEYIAKIAASRGASDAEIDALKLESGEQGRLNAIIAGLKFE